VLYEITQGLTGAVVTVDEIKAECGMQDGIAAAGVVTSRRNSVLDSIDYAKSTGSSFSDVADDELKSESIEPKTAIEPNEEREVETDDGCIPAAEIFIYIMPQGVMVANDIEPLTQIL
jgi:hypothetical protein